MQRTSSRVLPHGALRRVGVFAGIMLSGVSLSGCGSAQTTSRHEVNPALRQIQTPAGGSAADADRAALARFVGLWNFEGWTLKNGERASASGIAAATIENQHFVLIDVQTTAGAMGTRGGHRSGSVLLASEPGIGLTMTAWGDASPAISRSTGHVEGNASAFVFEESQTPQGIRRLSVTMTFETNDRWVTAVHDLAAAGRPLVAQYTFTRAPN